MLRCIVIHDLDDLRVPWQNGTPQMFMSKFQSCPTIPSSQYYLIFNLKKSCWLVNNNSNVGYPCCWIIHTSIMTIVILLSQYSPMIIPLTIPSSPRPGTWAVANGPKGRYSSESPRSAAGDVFFLFCFGLLQTLGLYGIIWDYMELLDVVRL